jgi:hypothetical protein
MATSHSSIPLNNLGLAQPIGVAPPIGSPGSGPALHHVSPVSVGAVMNGSANVNQNTGSNNTSSHSPPATSGPSNTATPPNSHNLRSIKEYWSHLANLLLAICALAAGWVTFRLTTWTAAKDWKEFCTEQTGRSSRLTQACTKAVNSELSAPPWIADWLHPTNSTIYKRYDYSFLHPHDALRMLLLSATLEGTFCLLGLLLCRSLLRVLKMRTNPIALQLPDRSASNPSPRVANHIPRGVPGHESHQDSRFVGHAHLRRRFPLKSIELEDDIEKNMGARQPANTTRVDDLKEYKMHDAIHDEVSYGAPFPSPLCSDSNLDATTDLGQRFRAVSDRSGFGTLAELANPSEAYNASGATDPGAATGIVHPSDVDSFSTLLDSFNDLAAKIAVESMGHSMRKRDAITAVENIRYIMSKHDATSRAFPSTMQTAVL